MTLFKVYFPESTVLKVQECCYCFIVFWPHNCVLYCKWDSNSEWYAVFSTLKFALIRSLLSMPVARLSFIFICAICSFQSRRLSIKNPRYLTQWVSTSVLPSNLNLKLWSIFSFLGLKITSSVFFTLRLLHIETPILKNICQWLLLDLPSLQIRKHRGFNKKT